MSSSNKDHSGKRFGRLTTIKRLSRKDFNLKKTSYECLCDCGNTAIVTGNSLVTGNTTSCGCFARESSRLSRSKNFVGERFSRLVAKERVMLPNRGVQYRCTCDCGNEIYVATSPLVSGNTKSCGCYNHDKIIERNRDPDLIIKRVTNCSNVFQLEHWKTNELLLCQGKWERNVVTYLNLNKLDFSWQIPFQLSDGRTYIVDFFDKSRNVYVEIKGWWRDDAKDKFDLFKSDHPSFSVEVWDKDVLLSKSIPIR